MRRHLFAYFMVVMVAPVLAQVSKLPTKLHDEPTHILVLDGSPVHNIGELHLHMSNWGAFGSAPGSGATFSGAPSGLWPSTGTTEHVYLGGLWVGAIKGGVPAVSTAVFETEFRPTEDALDIVYYSSEGASGGNRLPGAAADDDNDGQVDEDPLDGHDNDADGLIDEDYAAVSDQMLSRWYTDNQASATLIYPDHNPLDIMVRENSYQWEENGYDDFIGVEYEITNIGTDVLESVFLGIFADLDVGDRNVPNYWEDDLSGYRDVTAAAPEGPVNLNYAYMCDEALNTSFAVMILDHPTDPNGSAAPTSVGWTAYQVFSGSQSFENGGDPTNDFERYELMSSGVIDVSPNIPRDYRTLLSVGPFDELLPGATIKFVVALVASEKLPAEVNHVAAARTYRGQLVDGFQKHWVLPDDVPVPVLISNFTADAHTDRVDLLWEVTEDEAIAGFHVFRAERARDFVPLTDGLLPAEIRTFVDTDVKPGGSYRYQIGAYAVSGWSGLSVGRSVTIPMSTLTLEQNIPNPFNPTTTIAFTLAKETSVRLEIYNAAGQLVRTLLRETRSVGRHVAEWDGVDNAGKAVSSGVYFYRLHAGRTTLTRKMVMLK